MELPVDEEDDEEVVGVPEPLKVGPAAFLERKPDHHAERDGHDPARRTGTGEEVCTEEDGDPGEGGGRDGVLHGEARKVDHVREDVDGGADDDGPCGRLVKGDVLVEGDDIVERGAAEERDEVAADGKEDEDDVDVEDERGGTCNG